MGCHLKRKHRNSLCLTYGFEAYRNWPPLLPCLRHPSLQR